MGTSHQPSGADATSAPGLSTAGDQDAWFRPDLRQGVVFVRQWLRQGWRRARGSLGPILLASVAAYLAYTISHDLLGHPAPFFAPVAAWLCLGFTYNRIPRKVAEMGAGASIGVAVGEVVLLSLGSGPGQIALGLVLGGLIGRFIDRGVLSTTQSGVNAMVVIGLGDFVLASGGPFARWTDALIGSAVAFLFSVIVPGNLMARPRRYQRWLMTELATALEVIGHAVREGNPERLKDAHSLLRGVEQILDDASAALQTSAEIARVNPAKRKHRLEVAELARLEALSTRLLHTIELMLRQSRGTVDEGGSSPRVANLIEQAASVLRSLAGAVGGWHFPGLARHQATQLAALVGPDHVEDEGWRSIVLVSVLRSVVIDLLQLTGLSRAQARQRLADIGQDRSERPRSANLPEDEASALWGARPSPSPAEHDGPDVSG
ncbi:MAG: FUSC family protein [Micropruina sp.]